MSAALRDCGEGWAELGVSSGFSAMENDGNDFRESKNIRNSGWGKALLCCRYE
jgi:hypothetical protein